MSSASVAGRDRAGPGRPVAERSSDPPWDVDRWVLDAGGPALIRGAQMLLQVIVLVWLNGSGPSLTDRLLKWDGLYYLQITESGYSRSVTVGPDGNLIAGNEIAFHPLYPGLAALLHLITRMPPEAALLTVSAAAGVAAAVGVHLLTMELTGSRRAGYIAVALLGALPMSITFQMGYAESLFVALAAFGMRAALRGQWWWAAGFVFAAGMTRPTGLALVLVIPLAAWLLRRRGRVVDGRSAAAATVIAALGVPTYWVFLWAWTGRANAWFVVEQHGWDSHFDFGAQTVRFIGDTLAHPGAGANGLVGPVVVAVIIGYLVAAVLLAAGRWPLPVTIAGVIAVLLALTSTNFWHSKPRLLLTAFVVVIPAAAALNRFRWPAVVLLLAGASFASAWFGAYMLTIWPYAI